MKTIYLLLLITVFALMSCKKESANSDSITVPDTVNSIPVPAQVDTLVAAPKSDTLSLKKDSAR